MHSTISFPWSQREIAGRISEIRADGGQDAPGVQTEVTVLAIAETILATLDNAEILRTVYHLTSSVDRSHIETLSGRFEHF